jgi:3-oxoacyl-[acyl-carrier protein] reductase
MDLGIHGKKAIVCASSRGLGKACASALASAGVQLVINGRDQANLAAVAREIEETKGVSVTAICGDVTTDEVRTALLNACPEPDILVLNSGGPAPGKFLDYDREQWRDAVDRGMISPLLFVRAVLPGMRARKFGRIINIASAMVTTPRPHMTLSAGPRTGLVAALKAISLDVARDNVTINNLLPERIDTDRQHYMAQQTAQREGIDYETARKKQVQSIAAGRLGRPEEFGATCAFMCSVHAGFMSGMNLHLDGGTYPALV